MRLLKLTSYCLSISFEKKVSEVDLERNGDRVCHLCLFGYDFTVLVEVGQGGEEVWRWVTQKV